MIERKRTKRRRGKCNVGDLLLIPLIDERDRKETDYLGEWKPQPGEPCLVAQVIFVFELSVTLAMYSKMFNYSENLAQNITLKNSNVSHLVQVEPNYINWGTFKKIRNEEIDSGTPFQLYRFLGRNDTLAIASEESPIFKSPQWASKLDLMDGDSFCTGEAVIELMRHIHIEPIADGYEEINKRYTIRKHGLLKDLIGPEYSIHGKIISIIKRRKDALDPLSKFSVAPTNLTLEDFYKAVKDDPEP